MKKIIGILVAAMMLVTLSATCVFAQQNILVLINDEAVDFSEYGVEPQIIDSRTMVPLRAIFEALGASVEWDDATKTVTSVRDDVTVSLTVGAYEIVKNGEAKKLDVPAQIVDSRTLVPVRAISEAFGCEVGWDGETRTVMITYEEKVPEIVEVEGAVITLANAEAGSEKYAIYAGNSVFDIIADPLNASNKVYSFASTVTEKASWTYMWYNTAYKAGQRYIVEFDIMFTKDAQGDTPEKASAGICFKYATQAENYNKDHGVGITEKVPTGVWHHYSLVTTVPSDYTGAEGAFGIFAEPYTKDGVDHQVAMSMLLDNISVVPYGGAEADGFIGGGTTAPAPEEKAEDNFDYEGATGLVFDFNGDNQDFAVPANKVFKAENGVFVFKTNHKDPQIVNDKLSVDTAACKTVLVRFKYKNNDACDVFNIFFTTDSSTEYAEDKAVYLNYNDCYVDAEGYTWAKFDVGAHKNWKGTCTGLRFDPANTSGGEYEVEKIVFVQ